MNENEAIAFTQKHENLFLEHSSDIKELKSDVKELKSDVKELKVSFHKQGILQEEMSENINKILEVVNYNFEKYEREIPQIEDKLVNYGDRISALESSVKN